MRICDFDFGCKGAARHIDRRLYACDTSAEILAGEGVKGDVDIHAACDAAEVILVDVYHYFHSRGDLADGEHRQLAGHVAGIVVTRGDHAAHRRAEHGIVERIAVLGTGRVELGLELVDRTLCACADAEQLHGAVVLQLGILERDALLVGSGRVERHQYLAARDVVAHVY